MQWSVYLPDDLGERLRRVKEAVNVSQVCQAALLSEVQAAEAAQQGDLRPQIIERLRRTRTPEEKLFDRGVWMGRKWAAEAASLRDLRAAAAAPDTDPTLGGAMTTIKAWHQSAVSASLGRPAGWGEAVLGVLASVGVTYQAQQPEYVRGFQQGLREVWESVRSEFEVSARATPVVARLASGGPGVVRGTVLRPVLPPPRPGVEDRGHT
jgi:hypothetical protein